MPICPECSSSRFEQYDADKRYMICSEGHTFILIKIPLDTIKDKAYADKLITLLTKLAVLLFHWEVS